MQRAIVLSRHMTAVALRPQHPHIVNVREMVVGNTMDKIFMVNSSHASHDLCSSRVAQAQNVTCSAPVAVVRYLGSTCRVFALRLIYDGFKSLPCPPSVLTAPLHLESPLTVKSGAAFPLD